MVENASLVSHDGTVTNKRPCTTPSKNIDFDDENETVGHSVTREFFRNLIIPPETVKDNRKISLVKQVF